MAVKSVKSAMQGSIRRIKHVYHVRASLDLNVKNVQMEVVRCVKILSLLVSGNASTVGLYKDVEVVNVDSLVVLNVRMDITWTRVIADLALLQSSKLIAHKI